MHGIKLFLKSFSEYKDILGNRIFLYLFLTITVGFLESLGIIMFVPLIDLIVNKQDNSSGITENLIQIFETFNISLNLFSVLTLIILILVIKGVVLFFAHSVNAYLRSVVLSTLKTNLVHAAFSMRYRHFLKHDIGYFTDLLGEQTTKSVQSFSNFSQTFYHAVAIVFYSLLLIVISWELSIIAIIIAILMLAVFKKLNRYVKKLSQKSVQINNKLITDFIQNLPALKYLIITNQAMNSAQSSADTITKLANVFHQTGKATAATLSLKEPIALVFVGGMFTFGSLLGDVLLVDTITIILIVYRASSSLFAVQSYWQNMLNHIGGFEAVQTELTSLKLEQRADPGGRKVRFQEQIKFENVSFRHENAKFPSVKNLTFEFKHGQITTIMGASGSGKSTIIDLLMRLVKVSDGTITLDGISIYELNMAEIYSKVGFVGQESKLLDGTIYENIVGTKVGSSPSTITEFDISSSCKLANCSEFISKLPEGLNTRVGESGLLLSGGQRQRLLLAKELLRKPSILILDEATSALDSRSMMEIYRNIKKIDWTCTIIIISHQSFAAEIADSVIAIKDGTIHAEGSYQKVHR